MEPRSLTTVAADCAGELVGGLGGTNAVCTRVCTDSRRVERGDLFFAIVGERYDGHGFLAEASEKGAVGAVIARERVPGNWPGCPLVAVDDTRRALGRLASACRRTLPVNVVAVAGSNGKTTTKDLLAAVLRRRFQIVASEASFNNDVGVPLTLLRLDARHEAAVVELGTNHPGELAPLMQMAQPRFGVLTCIGREHLEFFGNLDGVIAEEGVLAELLPAEGTLFVNGDTDGLQPILRRARASVIRVGTAADNDWRARGIRMSPEGVLFRASGPSGGREREFRVPLLGQHQVTNALLAVAVGTELGLTPDDIASGLEAVRPARRRMELYDRGGVKWLDDSYNANADSMKAALETLRHLPAKGRRIAVLGDMAELGSEAAAAHREIGCRAAASHLDLLVTVGAFAGTTAAGAKEAGWDSVVEFADVESARGGLGQLLREGDLVLLKASRSCGLERVLEGWPGQTEPQGGKEAGSNDEQQKN